MQLTTEVAPGAGTKLLAIKNPDGSFTQVVALIPGDTGTSKFIDAPDVSTTPGSPQDLIVDTIPASTLRYMGQVYVVCRTEGSFVVTSNGVTIGEGKTGPASPNSQFSWSPQRPLAAGQTVKVTFTAAPGTRVAPVSAYLQASDVPV